MEETTIDDSMDNDSPQPGRGIDTKGRSLRSFVAIGVVINTIFDAILWGLTLIRGFVLAALLTRTDYGIWGVLAVSLGMFAQLAVTGIGDKYVQQDEIDQQLAFQKAFTMELLLGVAMIVPLLALLPVIAVVYGHWSLVAPGVVVISVVVAYPLQAPFNIWYRNMDFVRQRLFLVVEPIVGFIVAIVLAILGAGFWALVLGLAAGAWAGAAIAVATSPYPLRWRYDSTSLRLYASYSGPVFLAGLCSTIVVNLSAIAANARLGLAGVGAIALASNITQFATKVDDLVSETLYPAICRIQNRLDLLRESFVKSNRLALMWATPFGAGVALFAGDLVRFGVGDKWRSAVVLLRVTGAAAAIAHVGWNWDDYFRARANTRPIAVSSVAVLVTFLVCMPLVLVYGLSGLAIAVGAQTMVSLAFRAWYLAHLFEGFRFVRHALRAMLPTISAIAAVLIVRALETGMRTLAMALLELGGYAIVTVAATCLLEGPLLREAVGYLLVHRSSAASAPPAHPQ